jgi:hypothetical protein
VLQENNAVKLQKDFCQYIFLSLGVEKEDSQITLASLYGYLDLWISRLHKQSSQLHMLSLTVSTLNHFPDAQ